MVSMRHKDTQDTPSHAAILRVVFLVIFALLPFHAIFTTWLGSVFGHPAIFKSWKELLLILLMPLVGWILYAYPGVRKKLFSRRANRLIVAYGAVNILWFVLFRPELDAAVAALVMNLRFLAFFVLAQLLVLIYKRQEITSIAYDVLFKSALLVGMFGVLQVTVLPNDFLTHFGYGSDTIQPFLTIDDNPDFVRINSTLRGPNPLGAYLILPITALIALSVKRKDWRYAALSLSLFISLYASHSRSGWLGAVASLGIVLFFAFSSLWRRRLVLFGGLVVVVLVGGLFVFGRDSTFIEHVILHEGDDVLSEGSTLDHFRAPADAVADIVRNPIGDGPGTAGTASFYNESFGLRLSENYYLQIGQQFGVVGLVLFLALNVLVVQGLWRQRNELWGRVLLGSFAGLVVVNMLLHGFDDETTAMVWWGMAGLYYRES